MRVNKNENHAMFDCDDTLVMWPEDCFVPKPGRLRFPCPHSKDEAYYLVPHQRHINFLKAARHRGDDITVWSQAGWEWAETVVKVLGLEKEVSAVQTKPRIYVDDLPAEKWMTHIFFKESDEDTTAPK